MKINRQNYEMYLLDFMEGNLSASEAGAVQSFLENNPDIKAEAEGLLSFQLTDDTTFEHKHLLKKDAGKEIEGVTTFERLSVAYLEQEISEEENLRLDQMLEYSKEKQQTHQVIQKTRLAVDESIVFPNKRALKHYVLTPKRKAVYWLSSLAASVALLIAFTLLNSSGKDKQGFALAGEYLTKPSLKQPFYEEVLPTDVDKEAKKVKVAATELVETIVFNREKAAIEPIETRGIALLPERQPENEISSNEIAALSVNLADKSMQEARVEDYVNSTLQRLGIQQPVKEKSLLAKAGQSVWQGVNKFVKKRFQVKKVEIEDGRKLYAVKAGSLEFYTNLKGRKNKGKKPE